VQIGADWMAMAIDQSSIQRHRLWMGDLGEKKFTETVKRLITRARNGAGEMVNLIKNHLRVESDKVVQYAYRNTGKVKTTQ
jgi:hypothetical protein